MFEKYPVEPAVQGTACDLFKKEAASGPEHTTHLRHRPTPIGNMMNDPEIEDCIEPIIVHSDGSHIADTELQPILPIRRQPAPRPFHHVWIKIECVHFPRGEPLEDDLSAHTSTAPDFQHAHPFGASTQSLEEARLITLLEHGSHRIIHQSLLESIQEHELSS
jgi:hypothetical protein